MGGGDGGKMDGFFLFHLFLCFLCLRFLFRPFSLFSVFALFFFIISSSLFPVLGALFFPLLVVSFLFAFFLRPELFLNGNGYRHRTTPPKGGEDGEKEAERKRKRNRPGTHIARKRKGKIGTQRERENFFGRRVGWAHRRVCAAGLLGAPAHVFCQARAALPTWRAQWGQRSARIPPGAVTASNLSPPLRGELQLAFPFSRRWEANKYPAKDCHEKKTAEIKLLANIYLANS